METVIKVEKLSKQYRLGLVGASTFKEDASRWWAKMRGKEDPYLSMGVENERTISTDCKFVWSLKDVDFEVKKGEVLGVIGRNGAGKSTLLKILSKVTAPTTGSISIKGKIASLLEVGTGFHPELTGRENIFLNGAILGMRKTEIKRKLDDIIEFAGVEKYIDTPVKRYSSGMYVRLAFAVAAHLESDILIVDEVLAVGDAEFQKKCLGKIGEVSRGEGRTVLFVSHNLSSVRELCTSVLYMNNGSVVGQGDTNLLINEYIRSINSFDFKNIQINKEYNFRRGTGDFLFENIEGFNKEYDFLDKIVLKIKIRRIKKEAKNVFFYLGFKTDSNNELVARSSIYKVEFDNLDIVELNLQIPSKTFTVGTYFAYINIFDEVFHSYDLLDDIMYIKVSTNMLIKEIGFDPINPGYMIHLPTEII